MKNEKIFILIITLYLTISNGYASEEEWLVNGKQTNLSKQQFLTALQRMDKKTRFEFLSKERRVFKAVKNFYMTKVAVAQAKSTGLFNTPKMQALIEKSIGDTVLQEMYQIYLEKELATKKFTDLAHDYYKVNKNKYKSKPEIDASHILINYKSRTKKEARSLADNIRQQLIEGKEFTDLAIKYSEDPSVLKNKGRLGFFPKGKMVKQFSESAFALDKPGDISSIVETDFGYHIIRLEEKKKISIIPFEQLKDKLIKELKNKEIIKINEKFKAELLDESNIEINSQLIKSLVQHQNQ